MIKGKSIIGKLIVSYGSGKILHKISEVIYDPHQHKVLGFAVDESFLLSKGRHVPFNAVRSFGKDVITINEPTHVLEAKNDPPVQQILEQKFDLRGRRIMTESGEELGKITDLFFNETNGAIEGYEVSQGIVGDTYSGSPFLATFDIAKIGEDVVFVPDVTKEHFESQVGGIKASMQNVGNKTKETLGTAKEAVGQRVGYGAEFMDATKERTASFKDRVAEEFPQKSAEVKNKLHEMWENLKEKASDVKENASQQIEEKRINGALGLPVTRVIFDKEDQIILNTGELVTHHAIEQARENEVLDVLLSSVAKDEPNFTKEERKA